MLEFFDLGWFGCMLVGVGNNGGRLGVLCVWFIVVVEGLEYKRDM